MTERTLFVGHARDWGLARLYYEVPDRVMVLDLDRGVCPPWPDGASFVVRPDDPPEVWAHALASLSPPPQIPQGPKLNRAQRRQQRKHR